MTSDRPGSRLPDDPAYWEHLASRSVEAAFRDAPAKRESRSARAHGSAVAGAWWRGFSDSAFMLAASAVIALIGGSLLLDERASRVTHGGGALADVLAPDDPLLRSLMATQEEPTSAGVLLKLVALREAER